MAQFLLTSKRADLATEFERLKQTPSMSVIDYDTQFTQLFCYAPQLVAIEVLRIKRFTRELAIYLSIYVY